MKKGIPVFLLISIFLISFCEASELKGKHKVLYLDSYHQEYAWSAGILTGVKSVLDHRKDVVLKIVRMDTKRNPDEAFKKAAGLRVKKIIEAWKPDVVIASDDNASKYLIAPYYKNAALPLFCLSALSTFSWWHPYGLSVISRRTKSRFNMKSKEKNCFKNRF